MNSAARAVHAVQKPVIRDQTGLSTATDIVRQRLVRLNPLGDLPQDAQAPLPLVLKLIEFGHCRDFFRLVSVGPTYRRRQPPGVSAYRPPLPLNARTPRRATRADSPSRLPRLTGSLPFAKLQDTVPTSPPSSRELSPADSASARLGEIVAAGGVLRREDPELSEADTRAKLIDPLFKDVLGWYEADIRREEPLENGYVDYVLGAQFSYLHIEAKRLTPRFELNVPSGARILELSGPHLLGNASVRPAIDQAAKYASELGSEFAVVTNGDQFIVFRPRLPGRRWRDGRAIVWHGYDDILRDFARFYSWLSRDALVAGALHEAFDTADSITTSLTTPTEFIHNPDAELVRNRFWNRIARVVGPLFAPDPSSNQDEIIQHCYVRTPLSDEADRSIDTLLRDRPPAFAVDAGATDLKPAHGQTAFDVFFEKDIKDRRSDTYVLTGGVGSGKTTFLRRFVQVVQPGLVRTYCVWLHVDFLAIGNTSEQMHGELLRRHTYRRIREILADEYPELWPDSGAALREILAPDIAEAKLSHLYGLTEGSPQFETKLNELVAIWLAEDERIIERILQLVAKRGLRVVIVLDNTDQLGEDFQKEVFLFSQKLSASCRALNIVALREEKFFAAYRRGTFDAFGDRRFHIGSPNLEEVIRLRLNRALGSLHGEKIDSEPGGVVEKQEIERVLRALIRSTAQGNHNIVRMLSCVSNGDMRHALGMFREFISSGNTQIDKILTIISESGGYTVPFHEFAKSAILGSRKYFKSDSSHIVNVFVRSASVRSSHFTAIRLLARLAASGNAPSPHAEGFVDTRDLLGEFRASFGRADDLLLRGEELLRRGLLESEPPRVSGLEKTEAVRITASGLYYWKYLVRAFAYLDLVLVDTPVVDRNLARNLAHLAERTDMPIRIERVRTFLDYLENQERAELADIQAREGPYGSPLVPEIREQVEHEFGVIGRKLGL